jgi:hypothetical protein
MIYEVFLIKFLNKVGSPSIIFLRARLPILNKKILNHFFKEFISLNFELISLYFLSFLVEKFL